MLPCPTSPSHPVQGQLFPALTHFERSLEDAARDRVAGSARFQERREYVAGLARIVFRDPERAMRVVLDALPDQTRFDQMLAPVFAVVHLDPWWNPAVEDQASDRAHRIGQERPVTIYRLIMQDSIEERIVRLHRATPMLCSAHTVL